MTNHQTLLCTLTSAFVMFAYWVGLLSTTYKIGGALTFLAIAFIGGAITIHFLPETRGRELA